MNIPDAAIEAVARARHKREVDSGAYLSEKFQVWETLGKSIQKGYLHEALLDLEAAAPYIAAQGLRDAANESERLHTNAHEWLRDLANALEEEA